MKLLYITNSRFPSERAHMVQVVKMCNAFNDAGVTTTLAVTNRKTSVNEPAEQYYDEPFKFQLRTVPVFDLATLAGKLPQVLGRILYSLQRLSFIVNLGTIGEFDVVYGRDPMLLYLLGLKVGYKKIVYESHEGHLNFFVRKLVAKGVKIVVISEGIYSVYQEAGVPEAQLLVAHDAVDGHFFSRQPRSQAEARQQLGLPTDKKIAMYIGGFDAWKGVDTFFEASMYAQGVQLAAIGGTPEEADRYRQQYPKVLFLGQHPYNELIDNQQAADVLVVPNTARNKLSAQFTSPLKLFAHMAARLPLVVSDLPSMRNILDAKSAYFVPADDPKALADMIERVLQEPDVASKKAESAWQAAKAYTWDNRAARIRAFIAT